MLEKGFTLVELVVVITIIGLLATVGVASYGNVIASSRYTKIIGDMEAIQKAAEMYYIKNSIYPVDRAPEQLVVTWDPPSGFIVPKYLEAWPKPPCEGWRYDWDNWIRNTPHNSVNAVISNVSTEQIVRVTLKNASNGNAYMYCIYDANKTVVVPCTETGEAITDIKNLVDKKIKC
ncbi:prepilin-type N-terminal cleavage/methylation domain-containing protein [Candidatus Woesebacteria bacterium]|nr:prepilin-type N-terminal cleavage/methylation domain-containing protein [Candidatus Woesebacteria bacterium]